MRAVCGFSLSLLAWVQPVLGEDVSLAQERVRAPFWEVVHSPSAPRLEAHLRLARLELEAARVLTNRLGSESAASVRRSMERAVTHLGQALALAPQHREALYLMGKTLADWERPDTQAAEAREFARAQNVEAARLLEVLQNLDPLYEAEDVARTLGHLYAREHHLERAQRAYEHAIKMHLGRSTRSALLVQLASVCMARGELASAIEHYEAALGVSQGEERIEALWGLAVALDRAGETKLALARGSEALREGTRSMAANEPQSMRLPVGLPVPDDRFYFEGFAELAHLHEAAGDLQQAAAIARGATQVLARTTRVTPTLVQLHQALLDLAEQGQAPLVKKRLSLLEKHSKSDAARLPWEFPAKLPQEQSDQHTLQVTTYAARAFVAFARYLEHSGSAAVWAEHAQKHMKSLASVLRESAHAKNSFGQASLAVGATAQPRAGITTRAPQ